MKIYLDVCCLNRPFDSAASQPRVAIEAAAVLRLLELVESSLLTDYSSEMARIEIERIPDADRRRKVIALLPPRDRIIPLAGDVLDIAETTVLMGFGLADAVHLSIAQKIGLDVFVTVDDKLLKRAKRFAGRLGVRVIDPVSLLRELKDDNDR
jgi:predicted nucleic acid-binding protein